MTFAHKKHITRRFGKSIESYKTQATVQREMCTLLVQILLQISAKPSQVLEIGCGTGFLTKEFLKTFCVQSYTANDITPAMTQEIEHIAQKTAQHIEFLAGDAENISFLRCFDTIISASTLQWFHNLPQFFKNIQHYLLPQGILAFTTFGTENFKEITTLTEQSLYYYSAEELRELLAPDFHILHCETYCKTLYFSQAIEVLQHIRQTGVNTLSSELWTKSRLQQFCANYQSMFSSEKGLSLTYNPICIIAQRT
ncbi:MAG: malonyl-ACP O-methyltransferase BioC [Bacteroidales bacterium]|jgi:malonyl-CoA O-methyltransferase/biotin synthesis protein BioG|nr:malonyl-ACP O-methyltransferase BioC [Bacteroidales bacterium]